MDATQLTFTVKQPQIVSRAEATKRATLSRDHGAQVHKAGLVDGTRGDGEIRHAPWIGTNGGTSNDSGRKGADTN